MKRLYPGLAAIMLLTLLVLDIYSPMLSVNKGLHLAELVRIEDVDETILIELRYASRDNFTGEPVYPVAVALLRRETAEKLSNANGELMEMGYRIKVWDAYRPYHVHKALWQAAGSKRNFFADPQYGSIHNRGAAVDITLVDMQGQELEMPSDFDDFTGRGHRAAQMSDQARTNMDLLTDVMVRNGFVYLDFEWWHFADNQWWRYPILDLPLEKFIEPEPEFLR